MTLQAGDNIEHVRSKIEIERKEREKLIIGSLPHVAEKREEAREERRKPIEQPPVSSQQLKQNYDKFKKDWKQLGLIIGVLFLLGIGTLLYIVEVWNK